MPNRWVEFIKEYARKHNLNYMCAMTQPAAKQEYQEKYKTKSKPETKLRPAKKKAAPSKASTTYDIYDIYNKDWTKL